jgi:hypothetical protein
MPTQAGFSLLRASENYDVFVTRQVFQQFVVHMISLHIGDRVTISTHPEHVSSLLNYLDHSSSLIGRKADIVT